MATIILASTSPRRIDLLNQAGLAPRVVSPDTDETPLPGENPAKLVGRLAREKAESVVTQLLSEPGQSNATQDKDLIIIAADTIVVAPNAKTVLGKPRNEAEARKMLRLLVGKTHTVLTGYCVLKIRPPVGARRAKSAKSRLNSDEPTFTAVEPYRSHILVRVVTSRVKMRLISARAIACYVKTGEPMDKAGSYGAQGIGMGLIDSITGSYSNVVGLPMGQLLNDLEKKFGIEALTGRSGK